MTEMVRSFGDLCVRSTVAGIVSLGVISAATLLWVMML